MAGGHEKQSVLIEIRPETMRRAQRLALERHTSVSELLSKQIEALIGADDAYAQSERSAQELLERPAPIRRRESGSRERAA